MYNTMKSPSEQLQMLGIKETTTITVIVSNNDNHNKHNVKTNNTKTKVPSDVTATVY